MELDLTKVFEAIEKAPILKEIKEFTFKTKSGIMRRYVKTEKGWLRDWEGSINDDETSVKLVYIIAKKDDSFMEVKEKES